MSKYFKFFSNCVLTSGALNAIVTDLQRGRVQYIPRELFNLLDGLEVINFPYEDQVVNEYLEYFIEKELGFVYDEKERFFFPDIDFSFELPKKVYNVLIDFDVKGHSLDRLAQFITGVSPVWVSLRFFVEWPMEQYVLLFDMLEALSHPVSIDITMPYSKEMDEFFLKNLGIKYFNICQILQHSCQDPIEANDVQSVVMRYTDKIINSEKCCGVVNQENFAVNLKSFSEAKKFNSCLNGKLSIDKNGEVKNCPSMKQSFGHLGNVVIAELLKSNKLAKYWNLNKDQVSICKDCEFRYVCTDCRAYVEDPENDLSKPLKCGYNPYTGEWSEWSLNPLKKEASYFYKMSNNLL